MREQLNERNDFARTLLFLLLKSIRAESLRIKADSKTENNIRTCKIGSFDAQ